MKAFKLFIIILTFSFLHGLNCTNSTLSCNPFGTEYCSDKCICKNNRIAGPLCDSCQMGSYNFSSLCLDLCLCDPYGSSELFCNQDTGQCPCKTNVIGKRCDMCADGFYNLTYFGCFDKCVCNEKGSIGNCNIRTGNCQCLEGYIGRHCDMCASGYYESTAKTCVKCNCNTNGTIMNSVACESPTGNCFCKDGITGLKCDKCADGYYGLDSFGCKDCNCDTEGTVSGTTCNPITGQCVCKRLRVGLRCESCPFGYFLVVLDFAECIKCECHPTGSVPGTSCDSRTGECFCKVYNGVGGVLCDQCLLGFYNFSAQLGKCEPCGCNPVGSVDNFCELNGQCLCKDLVTGTKCDVCVEGSSGLSILNPQGCSRSKTSKYEN